MLQQNNNNNYLCLDMAHRELLQGCSRTSTPLSFGAIGFGAIPLIKGLRAWAVSGGFTARSRRKAVGENHIHQQSDRHRGWKTKENLATFRTPGALVTVATLKGSEGVRQTQTRCLFLKAEGCSYLCTMGNRVPGPRAAGQRMHPKSVEGMSRGQKASQEDAGVCEVKPQVIRKWRKSTKMGKSTDKSVAAEKKATAVDPLKLDQGPEAKSNSFTSQTDAQREVPSSVSHCVITPCLKAKHKHAANTTQSGTVNKNAGVNDVNETFLQQMCDSDTSATVSSSVSSISEVYMGQAKLRPHKDSLDANAGNKQKGHPVADLNQSQAKSKEVDFISAVPKSKDFSSNSEDLTQVNNGRNGAAEVERNISQSHGQTSIINASRTPANGILLNYTGVEQTSEIKVNEDFPRSGNEVHETIHSKEMETDEGLVMATIEIPKEDMCTSHSLPSVVSGSKIRLENDLNISENMEKNEDVTNTKNLGEPCGQSRERMDQEVVLLSLMKKEDALDMSCTNSQVEGPSVEYRSKANIDKDQGEVIIYAEEIQKNDEALDVNIKCHGQDHDATGVHEIKSKNNQFEMALHSLQIEKDDFFDIANTGSLREDHAGPLEECCPPQQMKEVNSGFEDQWFAKSPSRGPTKASVAVAIACLPNPAFTRTSNTTTAIATAPLVLARQEEVGVGFRSLGPQAESQLFSEQGRGQNWIKVATNERPVEVGEEEEDEFGVFMQAGQEQIWTEEFNGLQQVPSRTHDGIGNITSTGANEPKSWTSNWTGVQSFHRSDDTWATFKQEDNGRGVESEIVSGGQWWSSSAAENTHLTLSSLHNVSSVFLEAFPSVDSSSSDDDCVPTLKELLQTPAENNRAEKPQNQSLLDGLQDLDRMIDVKYKRAESLSRKLLLQSLNLGAISSERVSSHKQATYRFSPNLPAANQQLVASAKRRLSYDINRNIMA